MESLILLLFELFIFNISLIIHPFSKIFIRFSIDFKLKLLYFELPAVDCVNAVEVADSEVSCLVPCVALYEVVLSALAVKTNKDHVSKVAVSGSVAAHVAAAFNVCSSVFACVLVEEVCCITSTVCLPLS